MEFEWDRIKAAQNRKKHRVSFDVTIGYSSHDRLLVVVHAQAKGFTRIISARPANAKERKNHES
jgi:uncharacterized DUF497 family protein